MKKKERKEHTKTSHSHHGHSSHATHHAQHHSFKGIDQWIARLDNPKRDKKQHPDKVIENLELHPEDVVADIGAGTGYFALRIAKAYPTVKVIAADAQREMVAYLETQAKANGLANLEPVVIDSARPKLPTKANLALIVDTLHHIDDRLGYLTQLKESLLPDSRIAIIDYARDAAEGPPTQYRISKEDVASDLEQLGYTLKMDLRFLPNQYFLIFSQD